MPASPRAYDKGGDRGPSTAEMRSAAKTPLSVDFPVHVPRSLHRSIADLAKQDGVSLQEWVRLVLAKHVYEETVQLVLAKSGGTKRTKRRTR
jgi:hypothetical protein